MHCANVQTDEREAGGVQLVSSGRGLHELVVVGQNLAWDLVAEGRGRRIGDAPFAALGDAGSGAGDAKHLEQVEGLLSD